MYQVVWACPVSNCKARQTVSKMKERFFSRGSSASITAVKQSSTQGIQAAAALMLKKPARETR